MVLRRRARALRREVATLVLALRHPGTPRGTKLLAAVVVAYALSPIDLIPDFIPVLGLLDDLILVPLGVALVLRTMPPTVLAECRARVREGRGRGAGWLGIAGACAVVGTWLAALLLAFRGLAG